MNSKGFSFLVLKITLNPVHNIGITKSIKYYRIYKLFSLSILFSWIINSVIRSKN